MIFVDHTLYLVEGRKVQKSGGYETQEHENNMNKGDWFSWFESMKSERIY